MKYRYSLPNTLDKLVAATVEPDVKRLIDLSHAMGMFRAICDWPRLLGDNGIMDAAKEACKRLLLEEAEEGIAITNSTEAFTLLFIQTYYGAYQGVVETAGRSLEEMHSLVQWLRHRTEGDAIAVLMETRSTLVSEEEPS